MELWYGWTCLVLLFVSMFCYFVVFVAFVPAMKRRMSVCGFVLGVAVTVLVGMEIFQLWQEDGLIANNLVTAVALCIALVLLGPVSWLTQTRKKTENS